MDERSELEAMREELAELRQWKAEQEAKSATTEAVEPQAAEEPEDKLLQLRKERPLPKRGCSWAFYLFLVVLVVVLVGMFLKYRIGS